MESRKVTVRAAFRASISKSDGRKSRQPEKDGLVHTSTVQFYHDGEMIGSNPLWHILEDGELAVASVVKRTTVVSEFKSDLPMFLIGCIRSGKIGSHRGKFQFPLVTGMASTIPDTMSTVPGVEDLGGHVAHCFGPVPESEEKNPGTDLAVDESEKKRDRTGEADKRLLVLAKETSLVFDVDGVDATDVRADERTSLDGLVVGMIADVTFEVFKVGSKST
jgi:hypothetical protein